MPESPQSGGQPSLIHQVVKVLVLGSWVLTLPISFMIVGRMFEQPAADTTLLSNAAFGLLMLLANVSFSYARAVDNEDPNRWRIRRAGEELLFAALTFAAASMLKYGMLELASGRWVFRPFGRDTDAVMGIASASLFTLATIAAHFGIIRLAVALFNRRP